MGYGLGAAIGANIGSGSKTVLITGDGSFGMNLNELATVVTYRIPVIIIIMNNRVLGMVRQWQTYFYDRRYSFTELDDRKTDFVKLADAFGLKGSRVDNIEDFKEIFDEAWNCGEPYLIDACIDRDELVLPMMPPNGTSENIITSKEGIF